MTDEAAKPANGAPDQHKPAQIPPATAPEPTESLDESPAPALPPSDDAPPQLPPPGEATPAAARSSAEWATPPRPLPPRLAEPARSASPSFAAASTADPRHPVSRGLAVLLALICVLSLFGAGYLYWLSRAAAGTVAARLEGLEQTVAGLDQRLAAVEARPVASPTDLGPITERLAALEKRQPADLGPLDQRVAALEARPAVDLAPLDKRLAALEAAPPPPKVDLAPLDQRLTALEQKPPVPGPLDAAAQAALANVAGRVDQLTARQDQLGTREQSDLAKLQEQLAAQEARVAAQDGKLASVTQASTQAGGDVTALAARETRLAALQGAAGALAAGRPLGAIPGAPPALAQFADHPPPTEAQLRLDFTAAAQDARAAGLPPQTEAPLLTRAWARLQSSVTVRQGDRVLVGDPISGILARAQTQLDAGDLAGAVAALDPLAGPAAAAMAPWRQRAQSLLDARAALLATARG